MVVPDFLVIIEVELYSSGYHNAKLLADKIVSVNRLCAELLSAQCHYDFGMRTMKSILKAAETIKQERPNDDEYRVIQREINILNVSKLVKEDQILFKVRWNQNQEC